MNSTNLTVSGIEWKVASTFYGLISVASFIFNPLIIWTHWKLKEVRSDHHLIPALAVFDWITSFPVAFRALAPHIGLNTFTQQTCVVLDIPYLMNSLVGPWITFAMSFYRLLGFKYPTKYALLTRTQVLRGLYACFVVLAVPNAAWALVSADSKKTVAICILNTALAPGVKTMLQVIAPTGSLCVIFVNAALFREVRLRNQKGVFTSKRDARLAQSILIVSAVYVGTWLIGVAGFIYVNRWIPDPEVRLKYMYLYFGPPGAANIMVNYPIYISRSKDYRKILKCLPQGNTVSVISIIPKG